ncbi:MAG: hypothetical protein ACTHK4_04180, partial [Mycobacteriales bacterium]
VQLTDLDVIARYSIAVRSATADRDELLETLRADVAWLERGRARSAAFRAPAGDEDADSESEPPARPARSAAKKAPAKRATARRTAR